MLRTRTSFFSCFVKLPLRSLWARPADQEALVPSGQVSPTHFSSQCYLTYLPHSNIYHDYPTPLPSPPATTVSSAASQSAANSTSEATAFPAAPQFPSFSPVTPTMTAAASESQSTATSGAACRADYSLGVVWCSAFAAVFSTLAVLGA